MSDGVLALLVRAGILARAGSDNDGRVAPTSAQVTGDAIGGPLGSLFAQTSPVPLRLSGQRDAPSGVGLCPVSSWNRST
jgi:hypothetical protein